jgi:signal transduction histidine kinase
MGSVGGPGRLVARLRGRSSQPDARVLEDLYRSLVLHVDPEPLYASVLARLNEIGSCRRSALFLVDARDGLLRAHAHTGRWSEELLSTPWASDEGLTRWLGVNARGLLLAEQGDVVADLPPDQTGRLRRDEVSAVVPLQAADRLSGFLLFGASGRRGGWTVELVGLLTTLAVPASLAFEHSALVREEKQRLRRLYRAERLATAGTVAAGLAHEIRNPMTAIRSGIQLLRDESGLSADGREVIEDVIREVDRIDRLVGGLVSFARAPRATRSDIDVGESVRRAAALLAGRCRSQGVALHLDVPEDPVLVRGDAGQLEQVVVNVLLNALEAVEGQGEVRVRLARRPGEVTGRVLLEVQDDGPGLPAGARDRLFDPFFTTKPEGSGLGLPISFNIVRQHGGDLSLEDHPEGGVVVRVVLPETPS